MARFYEPTDMAEYYERGRPTDQGTGRNKMLAEAARKGEESRLRAKKERKELIKKAAEGKLSEEDVRALSPSMRRAVSEQKRASPKPVKSTTPETDTTDLNFADTPAEAAPQEDPMSDWDRARGQIYAGQRELDTAYGAQRGAEKKLAEAQAGQLSEENELADEQDEAYGRQVRALEAMQKINRDKLDDYDKGTAELEEDYNNSKIDPNRAFSSTGSKVAAAIAIALGAFAQGMSRGQMPNSALQIIEGAIKRDVDAQKTEMQKNRDVLLNRNNIYARMMARFNNEEVAYKATMALGFKHAGMKMQGLLRKHKGENAQLTINASLAKMDSKQKEFHLGNRKLLAEITVKEAQFQARSGAAQTKRSESIKLAMNVMAQLPNALMDFKKVSTIQGGVSAMMPFGMQQWFGGMTEAVTYENTRNFMAKGLTKAFDGGRPTEMDFKIFVQMFPAPDSDDRLGEAQFRNIYSKLNIMIANAGGLKQGMLADAAMQAGVKPSSEASKAGVALSDRAKAEEWNFKQGN